jgi:hypothetical protein
VTRDVRIDRTGIVVLLSDDVAALGMVRFSLVRFKTVRFWFSRGLNHEPDLVATFLKKKSCCNHAVIMQAVPFCHRQVAVL